MPFLEDIIGENDDSQNENQSKTDTEIIMENPDSPESPSFETELQIVESTEGSPTDAAEIKTSKTDSDYKNDNGSNNLSTTAEKPAQTEAIEEVKVILTDVDVTEIVVKRIWTLKMANADKKYFNSDTRSIQNLKDPFVWVNNMVTKVVDKKKTFQTLLYSEILFVNPGQNDERLAKYKQTVDEDGETNQSIVIGYKTFIRFLLKMICKDDTFMLLSRNFGRLETRPRTRKIFGEFIDQEYFY